MVVAEARALVALEVLARAVAVAAVVVVAVEVAAPLEGGLPWAQAWPSPWPVSSLSSSSGPQGPSQRVSVSGAVCTRRIAAVFSSP